MTVSSTLPTITYLTTGSLKTFNIPFDFSDPSHITVTVTDRTAEPVSVTQIDPSNFTVLSTPLGTSSKGTVTYPKAPTPALSSGYYVTVGRSVPIDQTTNLINQSGFFLEDIERSLDKLTQICQQLREVQTRSILLPVGGNDTPSDFLEGLEAIAVRAETSADRAEAVEASIPSILFQDVFTTSASTYTLDDTHNGTMLAVSPPSTGTSVVLPQLTDRTEPYAVSIRNMTGTGDVTISTVNSETINYKNGSDTGSLSITLSSEGDEAILAGDLSGATAGKWVTFGYRPNGTLPLSRLEKLSPFTLFGNSLSTETAPAEIELDDRTMAFVGGSLVSFGSFIGGYSYLTGGSYAFDDTRRGHLINFAPDDSGITAVTVTLPDLTTVTKPTMYLVRRASTTKPISFNRDGTNLFASGSHTGTTTTSYALPTTVGSVVLIYGVTSGLFANRWIPIPLN